MDIVFIRMEGILWSLFIHLKKNIIKAGISSHGPIHFLGAGYAKTPLRASNNIPLQQNRLRSSEVRNILKHSLCRLAGSRGIEIVQALPSQSGLHLVRRIGGERQDIPTQKTIRRPDAVRVSSALCLYF